MRKTDKVKILVPVGCRSDAGLSAPIIKRLEETPWCECEKLYLIPADYQESYIKTDSYFNIEFEKIKDKKPDLVLCVGDRTEMAAAARAAFDNQIPIGHVYAGALGDFEQKATLDDINRFVISLYADICFCEDYGCALRVKNLWFIAGKFNYKFFEDMAPLGIYDIHIVGITHMDDLEIDESLKPLGEYDLILLNRTINKEVINDIDCAHLRNPIFIKSNPDGGFLPINIPNYYTYDNLPRSQFLGLLKNCSRFITNSSAAYYEAPFFLKKEQVIQVGIRNSAREFKKRTTGASDKIVKILEGYFKK